LEFFKSILEKGDESNEEVELNVEKILVNDDLKLQNLEMDNKNKTDDTKKPINPLSKVSVFIVLFSYSF
jgi:hypothetical protein